MIRTENLYKNFGKITAVENLSLEVQDGEIFGFLGPNGAGKTTTIRILACLIGATSGKAYVADLRVGKDDDKIRQRIGILTETPGMYENLTADYNLRIFGKLHGVVGLDAQIEKYLKLLGLWERRFDVVGTFSKGMKQKVAIARTLLHEPDVIFLDEPTSGLDPESAHLVREFIAGLRRDGRTIFLCTHNLDEAERLCSRIGVFKTRLLTIGTPAELRASVFGRKVVFHLRLVDGSYLDEIRSLDCVNDAHAVENKIVVNVHDPEQTNPEVIRLLVSLGADIQYVGELRRSLEDVYLQLVKDA